MQKPRHDSAAASHPDHGWVITGGYERSYKSSAESTRDGRTFQSFPELPLSLSRHCLVSLDGGGDSGDFLLTGGWDGGGMNKKTLIFEQGEWRQVEDMPTARDSEMPDGGI